jgi:hypothetical protein
VRVGWVFLICLTFFSATTSPLIYTTLHLRSSSTARPSCQATAPSTETTTPLHHHHLHDPSKNEC